MRTKTGLFNIALFFFLFTASMGLAKDYIIFSISQDFPMGYDKEVLKKNYYVNIGEQQGVKEGTVLDVFRTLSRLDPYTTKQRYNYKVKVGELKVIHSEDNAAITTLLNIKQGADTPLYEIDNFMIGDQVNVKVKD